MSRRGTRVQPGTVVIAQTRAGPREMTIGPLPPSLDLDVVCEACNDAGIYTTLIMFCTTVGAGTFDEEWHFLKTGGGSGKEYMVGDVDGGDHFNYELVCTRHGETARRKPIRGERGRAALRALYAPGVAGRRQYPFRL